MAHKIIYVKLRGEDFAKEIQATDAIDDGFTLVLKDDERVIARFQLDRVEHWYPAPSQP